MVFWGGLKASPLILESPLRGDVNMKGDGVFRRGLVDRYFSHLLYVPAVLGVLGGVGASLDDGTVFEDGVEDIGEDDDGGRK